MIRDREKIRLGVNVLLTAGIVYLEIKKLYAYNFDTLLPYVFFLFTFVILQYGRKLSINDLSYGALIGCIAVNFTVTFILYNYYTYYEHKSYFILWFPVIFATLLLPDLFVPSKNISKEYAVGALILGLLSGIGYGFENSQPGDSWRQIIVNILLVFFCWFILFLKCFLMGDRLLNRPVKACSSPKEKSLSKCFGICFAANFLLWIPVFLSLYPAVLNSDPVSQMMDILGMTQYSNHHSWYYTLLIELWYRIGYFLFGTVNGGIAVYTLFSMAFMASAFALAVTFLYRRGLQWHWLVLIEILYGLDPIKAHHTMAMWKDVPFAALLLIFAVVLAEFHFSGKWLAGFWATGIAVCLLRNNGIYLFLLLCPVLLLVCRKNIKFLGKAYIPVILVYFVMVKIVMPAANVKETGLVESLSIPLQQIAYTVCEEGNIDEEEYRLINAIADTEKIKEEYYDWNAGHMKHLVSPNEDLIRQNKGEYFRLWLEIGLKNPYCYLKAYVEQTKGYWFPTECLPVRTVEGVSGEEVGVERHVLWLPQEVADKIINAIWVYGGQVYPKYFCLGLWTYLCIFIICFLIRRKGYWMAVLPALLNLATLLIAAPLCGDFKYAYPTYCFVPLGIGVLLLSRTRKLSDSVVE